MQLKGIITSSVGPAVLALVLALGCTWVAAGGASSAPSASKPVAAVKHGGPEWSALTGAQRSALAPLERDWNSLESDRKSKWLEVAARFPKMQPEEQARVQTRMTEWARMTPTQRGQARLSFQEAKQLTPQERQLRWEAYKALPEGDRKALMARASAAATSQATTPHSTPLAFAAMASAPGLGIPTAKHTPHPATSLVHSVGPTTVQATPGATTTSVTKGAKPPAHQQPGQPHIAAKAGQVDRTTLLPKPTPAAAAASATLPTPPAASQPQS